jgi:hypothetical protein
MMIMTTDGILARGGVTREELGAKVRDWWIRWALTQPDPKPSWLVPFEALSPADREADMMIGEELFCLGFEAAQP